MWLNIHEQKWIPGQTGAGAWELCNLLAACGKADYFGRHNDFPSQYTLTSLPAPLSTRTCASLLSTATPHPFFPLHRRLQEPCRDHRSATRQQGLRNCQTQGGLSVREDQSLCKPLRHSNQTPPPLHNTSPRLTGTLCLQLFCLVEKVMWVKRRKTDGGGEVEGGKGKKEKKKHLCGCVRVRARANVSMHFSVCVPVSVCVWRCGQVWEWFLKVKRPHSIPISRSFLRWRTTWIKLEVNLKS